MTLDFPTRLRWAWCPLSEAWNASLGTVASYAVWGDKGLWRRPNADAPSTDLRTAILAAEDEAIDLLCGALADLREPT